MKSVVQLLQEHNIDFRRHGESPHVTEGWVGVVCPFCARIGKHRNYGLGINLSGHYCSCWACGPHRLPNVLAELTGKPLSEFTKDVRLLEKVTNTRTAPGRLELPPGVADMGPAHRRYLRDRGFDPDSIEQLWKVQGIGIASGSLQWRLFIPIHRDGEVVSWTTRAISDTVPIPDRYRGAKREQERIRRQDLLYGEDHAQNSILIVEGPTDVWRVGPGAICTLGTGYTRAQLHRAARFPRRAVGYDSEPAARWRAEQLVRDLEAFPGETYLIELESGKDWASADAQEIEEVRRDFLGVGI